MIWIEWDQLHKSGILKTFKKLAEFKHVILLVSSHWTFVIELIYLYNLSFSLTMSLGKEEKKVCCSIMNFSWDVNLPKEYLRLLHSFKANSRKSLQSTPTPPTKTRKDYCEDESLLDTSSDCFSDTPGLSAPVLERLHFSLPCTDESDDYTEMSTERY